MAAQIMAGAPVADAVMADVAARVARLARHRRPPGLGTILVGDDPASAGYVARKHEACQRVGMRSFNRHLPATATQEDLLGAVREWNADPDVDGF
ncbi:MAG TPA: tetrahydrofolate dehydrogenase/cyclohydrolase catalytic domain-containing protein, partial [Acidimicrobiales bacterium]|nr:tetrahydrofolate dehydrogenase/cyclohydrolase catalytic domain-containing protein [Acidimicrobiales bacterium]